VLGRAERDALLAVELEVEEKVDGANVMCWLDAGVVRCSGRSGIEGADRARQFGALRAWVGTQSDLLAALLEPGDVLYGEWLLLTHTIAYTRLPDFFVALDLRRSDGTFLRGEERRRTLEAAGLVVPPLLGRHRYRLDELESLTAHAAWAEGPAEGVVVRPLATDPAIAPIAKLVRADFVPIEDSDWRRGRPSNRLASV
jgi:atypical dual specificity phosphatase